MKFCLAICISFIVASCCSIGQRDCMGFNNQAFFRLQNAAGQDLVFGNNKQFPLYSIRAFSIKNNDSLFHQLNYQVFNNNDTVISALFNYEKFDTVYMQLGASGNNRLINNTRTLSGKCCDDFDEIVPVTFNGKNILSADNVNILIK